MSPDPVTPDELRREAHRVLDRLRALDRAANAGIPPGVDEVDETTASLATFQTQVERTARHYNHSWAMQDVLAARRDVDRARLIVLRLLGDLRSDDG